jgi:nucleotide-binding universal stress UspA family protein
MTSSDTPSATPGHRPRIIVGVDGSPGANRALSWAFSEAEQRGADLEVVIAWDFPYKWAEGFNTEWGEDTDYFARAAGDEAGAAVDAVLEGKPRPAWLTVHSIEGPAAQVLTERAKGADALVVGTRGRGGFTKLLLGSVSNACVHHAPCPVCVIPDE